MTLGRLYRRVLATSLRGRGGRVAAALVMLAGTCGYTVVVAASAGAATASPAGHAHVRMGKASPDQPPTGGFGVNINSREDVRQFYSQVYQSSNGVPEGWTGSIAGCNPGTVSPAFLAATLTRINYFRTMAGEPDVTFNGTGAGTSADPNNAEAQAAALMESANNFLQHTPPQAGTNCWTQQAFDGSSHSNLFETPSTAAGATGAPGIDDLMQDEGALGHRRNMLNPLINVMGAGSVPATTGFQGSEAQLVLTTPLTTRPPTRTPYIAWPPAGYVPYQVVYPVWSFSLPGADFSNATVSVTLNGTAVTTQINCFDPTTPALLASNPSCGLYGDPAISWALPDTVPIGSTWPKPAQDQTFDVTIGHVVVNGGAPQNFSYSGTIFDPAVQSPADTISQPTGPATPTVSSQPSYSVTALTDPQISGYQWQTVPLSPGGVADDPATNGLTNWTPGASPATNPLSTAEPTGATAFNLASDGASNCAAAPAQQTLTLNQSVFASASSQLSFGNVFSNMGFGATSDQTASVDVSTDGGATWNSAWSQSPLPSESDTAFTPQTVSLSQYAGKQIQLRFSLTYTGGEWACSEPGWFFDNVSLTGVQDAGTPTLSAVSTSPSFTFDAPVQPGTFAISARPQFTNSTFGSAFLNWSSALVVSTVQAAGTATSVTSSPNPAAGGQQVTYTATVAPVPDGGTVSFSDNGNPISGCQSQALTGGQATCAQTYTFGGSHSIVAAYSGDTDFTGSTSPTLTQVVNAPQATTVSLTSSAATVSTGQQVTFTATVTPTDGGGTVDFNALEDSTAGCPAAPLNAAGQATCVTSFSVPRVQSQMQAFYSGDANFVNNSPSAPLQETVIDPTSTSVTSSANPSNPGDQVTYTATVTGSQYFLGYGSVSFSDDGTPIAACQSLPLTDTGTMHTHQATCAQTYPNGGAHSIQAFYSGYAATDDIAPSASPALSQSVGTLTATTTTLTSSANPANTGQQVTYTATAAGSDGGGTVSFTDAGFPITGCQAESLSGSGTATCAQTYASTSTHPIVAVYSGDGGFAGSSSATLSQAVVIPTPPATTAAVTNVGNGAATIGFGTQAGVRRDHGVRAASSATSTTGYNVYQGTAPGKESSTPVNSSRLLATATGYHVSGLKNGTKYYFVVRALNPGGLGAKSKEVSTTPATAPGGPHSLKAHAGKESAALTWTAPASNGGAAITGYSVYVGTVSGQAADLVNSKPLSPKTTSYTVKNLTDGTKYYFIVRADNPVAVGAASGQASATPATVPDAPTSLLATSGNTSVGLTWKAPAWDDFGTAISGYNIYKGTSSGHESATPVNAKPLSPATRSYTVTGLKNGTKYYFTVKAIDSVGTSAPSSQVSAIPKS